MMKQNTSTVQWTELGCCSSIQSQYVSRYVFICISNLADIFQSADPCSSLSFSYHIFHSRDHYRSPVCIKFSAWTPGLHPPEKNTLRFIEFYILYWRKVCSTSSLEVPSTLIKEANNSNANGQAVPSHLRHLGKTKKCIAASAQLTFTWPLPVLQLFKLKIIRIMCFSFL